MSVIFVASGQETVNQYSGSYSRSSKIISQTQAGLVDGVNMTYEGFEGDGGEYLMFKVPKLSDCPDLSQSMFSFTYSTRKSGSNNHYRGGRLYIYDDSDEVIMGMYMNGSSGSLRVYLPILKEWRDWEQTVRFDDRNSYVVNTADFSTQAHPTPGKVWLVTSLYMNGIQCRTWMDEVDEADAQACKPEYMGLIGGQSTYPNYRMHYAIGASGRTARNLKVKQILHSVDGTVADQTSGTAASISNRGGDPEAEYLTLPNDGNAATFTEGPISDTWLNQHRIVGVYQSHISAAGDGAAAPYSVNVIRGSDGVLRENGSSYLNNFTDSKFNANVAFTEINPETGAPWKTSEINALEFGVKVKA